MNVGELVLIFIVLISFINIANAEEVVLNSSIDSYQDYLGVWHRWDIANLTNYPAYIVIENDTGYTIERLGDTVRLPKRSWLTYSFGFDKISTTAKINNYSQINQLVTKDNATNWYLAIPWSASNVKSVNDNLIDMGVFKRYLGFQVLDSNATEYNMKPRVVGNEIRLYFNPQEYSYAAFPIYINESTITTLVANCTGFYGYKQQTTGENLYATTLATSQTTTPWTALTSTELDALSVDDTSYAAQAGSSTRDAFMFIRLTMILPLLLEVHFDLNSQLLHFSVLYNLSSLASYIAQNLNSLPVGQI